MIRAVGDRVLVSPPKVKEMTEGGIFLPQTARLGEHVEKSEVMQDNENLGLKKGDIILHSSAHGYKLTIEDIDYKILEEEHVLAILEDN